MLKPSSGRNKGRQGLAWGKGTKRLVRRVEELGYKLEYKNGELIMTFMGACPPYDKKIRPVLQAISDNTDAVIGYLKYIEARKTSKKGDEESEPIQKDESVKETRCSKSERSGTESSSTRSQNGPLRHSGFLKWAKSFINHIRDRGA
ncbi:hypothetical protein SCFA_3140002 [anaerobic digester metagenome]|uniref:Uncharacterized protein n=1 Tax=anaerobic digester metagenome TaxID=1263854 RepID=A0A485M3U9_9ZZZZ